MRRVCFLVAAMLTIAMSLRGDDFLYERTYFVRVGDLAPEFESRDETGKVWRSKDHFGKKPVVMVFYMGDFMPDCNKRLSAYRDLQPTLASLGAEVIGISGDMPENHEAFRKAHRIDFPLLADSEAKASKEYGIYASSGGFTRTKDANGKDLRLKRGATLSNWTFVIGTDGRVIYKEMNADAIGDPRRVYELLYRLAAARK